MGRLKSKVYIHPPRNIEELKERISEKLPEFRQKFYAASWETCVEDYRNACTETEVTSR
jgi:cation transport regulator ChaB